MIKKVLILSIIAIVSQSLFSKPIDQETALLLAKEFYQKQKNSRMRTNNDFDLSLVYTSKDIQLRGQSDNTYYYIFNKTNEEGFIIISGDDKVKTVLGYSDRGNYDPENLPDNLKYLLNRYEEEIKLIIKEDNNKIQYPYDFLSRDKKYKENIEPLLGQIAWNQDSPYNSLCPVDKSGKAVTGCVATAMAQIMRYHKWPQQGKGEKKYRTRTNRINLSVDFSKSIYDWESMTERYSNNSTDKEINAVARLMYDCGVAVEMDYTSQASGALSESVPEALINFFDYDPNLQFHDRMFYTSQEWMNLVKEELNNNRPVYISAQSSSSAHAFVCDGYDSNNLFHINWGWGGVSNGYFEISTLNPSQQGIGGGSGGYNILQSVITGIQPPTDNSKPSYKLALTGNLLSEQTQISRGDKFTVSTLYLCNYGCNDFNGQIGIGLYQGDNLKRTFAVENVSLEGFGLIEQYFWRDIILDSDIPEGTYRIYGIYKPEGSESWQHLKKEQFAIDCLDLFISNEDIRISSPDYEGAALSIPTDGLKAMGNIYQNKSARFSLQIDNAGKEVNTVVWILIFAKDNPNDFEIIAQEGITIPENKSITLELSGHVPFEAGEYYVQAMHTNFIYIYGFEGESFGPITILDTPSESPKLLIEGDMTINKTDFIQGESLELTASIKNKGGYYGDQLYAFIFREGEASSSNYIPANAFIEKDETASFRFNKTTDEEPGNYRIQIAYNENGHLYLIPGGNNIIGYRITGTDNISSTNIQDFIIYPNPVEDYLYITYKVPAKSIQIFNLSGKELIRKYPDTSENCIIPVNQLNSGVYILQITTDKETKTKKFIKK